MTIVETDGRDTTVGLKPNTGLLAPLQTPVGQRSEADLPRKASATFYLKGNSHKHQESFFAFTIKSL
jgi:hypothetical protein